MVPFWVSHGTMQIAQGYIGASSPRRHGGKSNSQLGLVTRHPAYLFNQPVQGTSRGSKEENHEIGGYCLSMTSLLILSVM